MNAIERPPLPLKLVDVARLAGVSVATASRALSRPGMVSKASREAVKKAADQVGYRPNLLARSLRTQSSQTALVLMRECHISSYADIIRGIDWTAHENGYCITLGITGHDGSRTNSFLETAHRQRTSGVVAFDGLLGEADTEILGDVPCVQILESHPASASPSVVVDCVAAVSSALSHLVELGHRRIAFLGDARHSAPYQSVLAAHGIPFDPALVVAIGLGFEQGPVGMKVLMDLPQKPTAVFFSDDAAARGALFWANMMNIKVPGEISLMCLGENGVAARNGVELTMVNVPRFDLGSRAFHLLHEMIMRRPLPDNRVRMVGTLVQKGTTGRPATS